MTQGRSAFRAFAATDPLHQFAHRLERLLDNHGA
jgi:hypothetical protein